MDYRQVTYIAALAIITLLAWRQWRLTFVLWVNLAITLATVLAADLGHWTYEQATIRAAWGDLTCAIVLLSMAGNARVLGYLCLPMPAGTLAGLVMGYSSYDAYTLAYVLGYVQLAVVWVVDGTSGHDGRGSGHRRRLSGCGGVFGIHGGRLLHYLGRDRGGALVVEKGVRG